MQTDCFCRYQKNCMSCTKHRSCQCYGHAAPARQNLEEVKFLKSACSAAQINDLKRLAKLLAKTPGSINDDGVAGSPNLNLLCATLRKGRETICKTTTCLQSLAYILTLSMLAAQVRVAILHSTMQHEQGTKMQSPCSSTQAQQPHYSANSVAPQTELLAEHRSTGRTSLHAGADVNMATRAGRATPLHRAAYMGHIVIANCL